MNAHNITVEFEKSLCEYTGAPYAVALDNCSNALFLALYYFKNFLNNNPDLDSVECPSHTYPAVPAEIIHAGFSVSFYDSPRFLKGEYQLYHTTVFDSALRFTTGMYRNGCIQCLSFTGPFKHLKLGKGGAILTDNEQAYKWFKKARFSGRSECGYHDDNFDLYPVIGWNFYMMPEIAARGLHMMPQFYDKDGKPKSNPDLEIQYPDLSTFKLWK